MEPTPAASEGKYPVDLTAVREERSSRLLALLFLLFMFPKIIILIPHLVVLWFLQIAAFITVVIAQFIILFTGHFPRGMWGFVLGVQRWQARVSAYLFGITDKYPPLSLQ